MSTAWSRSSRHPSSPKNIPPLIRSLLSSLGENPARAGLEKTPERAGKFFEYITHGYDLDLKTIINGAVFPEKYDEMVLVRDIEFFSLCEHHLLPFFGKAHIAYIPNGKVVGLSKIPRIVDMFAHRLQLQERLTEQIADALA